MPSIESDEGYVEFLKEKELLINNLDTAEEAYEKTTKLSGRFTAWEDHDLDRTLIWNVG